MHALEKSRLARCGLAVLILLVVAGCEGDTGPAGPRGESAVPDPVSFLVFATSGTATPLALGIYGVAELPEGSTVDALAAFQGQVPTLDELRAYDVVVSYAREMAASDSLGDRLAEYVDAGGKVILAQGAFTDGLFEGRITEEGYSPFAQGPAAGNDVERRFDFGDFPLPPHPIFAGLNLGGRISGGDPLISSPALQGEATVLAKFQNDVNAVALNADGNVLGINLWPVPEEDAVVRLFAGGVLWLAGAR